MKWVFLKEFRDFIRSVLSEECDEDMMYFHILDCIEALTHIRTVGTTVNDESFLGSKRRVFWQLVREVADRQKEIKKVDIVEWHYPKSFAPSRAILSDRMIHHHGCRFTGPYYCPVRTSKTSAKRCTQCLQPFAIGMYDQRESGSAAPLA
jgi:hypothetical protein